GQWVRAAAAAGKLEHAVCQKLRQGDLEVQVALPGTDLGGRPVVLLDDLASTGRTLEAAARVALARGAASVDVAVTHGLFIGDALDHLRAAGVRHVWSSDCVPHTSNAVSVVPLLAAALRGVGG
ncbi:MAG TPA: phosphoribosyltransferase family protein, partial [Rubrivivax sp.]|nr:phosphoribosyltransferase family protein [Rubrivivax sp.]